MDGNAMTVTAALDRANAGIAQLLRRFENIVALAPDSHDVQTAAVETYQIQVETAALVAAAEELMTLTRALKEAWLFGRLDTVGPSAERQEIDQHAETVTKILQTLQSSGSKERASVTS